MEADFDPEDKYSWFFGQLSRLEANSILDPEHSGVFLVRESKTQRGDFVLCVKEEERISHYIVNRVQTANGNSRFKIGDKEFGDIPSLLNFYKTHYLDTTTLVKPAPRTKLLCKYDFGGRDPEDLPFKRGDILEVISQDEDEWWTARNSSGQVGQIPVRYTGRIERTTPQQHSPPQYIQPNIQPSTPISDRRIQEVLNERFKQIKLPAEARVILQRIPSAYDKTQLRLEVGDIVKVTKMNMDGSWDGVINGKHGKFPFTHIEFLSPQN